MLCYRRKMRSDYVLYVKAHNDGTGTRRTGNYYVEVSVNEELLWKGQVTGHRRIKGFPALLKKIATVAMLERKKILNDDEKVG